MNDDLVYFELNNWEAEKDYPNDEPFITWMDDDIFTKDDWCKKHKIVVTATVIDMSLNFCIVAPKEFVVTHCPKLLTDYTKFIRNESDWGIPFREYESTNYGVLWYWSDDNTWSK